MRLAPPLVQASLLCCFVCAGLASRQFQQIVMRSVIRLRADILLAPRARRRDKVGVMMTKNRFLVTAFIHFVQLKAAAAMSRFIVSPIVALKKKYAFLTTLHSCSPPRSHAHGRLDSPPGRFSGVEQGQRLTHVGKISHEQAECGGAGFRLTTVCKYVVALRRDADFPLSAKVGSSG